ncbi:hypothetical protein AB0C29_20975 [Actinoplanes sp. NPDC048791]|uniref:hypothetical protein n=1 Tax=Actinoplanes sp. NPDC048791 TaxID=3154623 RepID=UPI0034001F25
MPTVGDVFQDVRGDDRTMRVSYHQDRGVMVVSLWAGPVCRGSFRLAADEISRLAMLLSDIVSQANPPETPEETTVVAEVRTAPTPDQTGDVSMSIRPIPRVA